MDKSSETLVQAYIDLLIRWNATYRLVGHESSREIWNYHVIDAEVILPHLQGIGHLVDLGSGPGLPGLLIKILRPQCSVTLIEPQRKRVNFCEEAVRRLKLHGVQVIQGRAEDKSVIAQVCDADAVITRATWGLDTYVSMGTKYLSAGGLLFALRGSSWREDCTSINKSHNTVSAVPYSLVCSRVERALIQIQNVSRETF